MEIHYVANSPVNDHIQPTDSDVNDNDSITDDMDSHDSDAETSDSDLSSIDENATSFCAGCDKYPPEVELIGHCKFCKVASLCGEDCANKHVMESAPCTLASEQMLANDEQ